MQRSLASRSALALLFAVTSATTVFAQQAAAPAPAAPATPQAPAVACDGDLSQFLAGVKADAIAAGCRESKGCGEGCGFEDGSGTHIPIIKG